MQTGDWLARFHPRYARVLQQAAIGGARATLVDSNGDGRELCFCLEVLEPSGEWTRIMDWDDVGTQVDPHQLDYADVVVGWGTAAPGRPTSADFGGTSYPVEVSPAGWWLLLIPTAEVSEDDQRSQLDS